MEIDKKFSQVDFSKTDGKLFQPMLFDEVAEKVAIRIAKDGESAKKANKPTQIRKFYDELCMWHEKVQTSPDKFDEFLPFIKMLNAKAAYAYGRKSAGATLVDEDFVNLMKKCLAQVKNVDDMKTCKTFFEAFMGFYKAHRPKD